MEIYIQNNQGGLYYADNGTLHLLNRRSGDLRGKGLPHHRKHRSTGLVHPTNRSVHRSVPYKTAPGQMDRSENRLKKANTSIRTW